MSKKKRTSLSKKARFDIFKRDEFHCQYCGSTPPSVVLEVDHIKPVSKGGCNSEHNLITACFDCNRGKAANELSVAPMPSAEKLAIMKEKAEQLKSYERVLRAKKAAMTRKVNKIEEMFTEYTGCAIGWSAKKSMKLFLENLPAPVVEEAMEIATETISSDEAERVVRYFCGVCWNRIREKNEDLQ